MPPKSAAEINAKAFDQLQSSKLQLQKQLQRVNVPSVHTERRAASMNQAAAQALGSSKLDRYFGGEHNVVEASKGAQFTSISGRLYQILEFLKAKEQPQTAEQIKQHTQIDLRKEQELLQHVVRNVKIKYEQGRFSYKPTYTVQSKGSLLELVKQHWVSGQGGVLLRDLKDTWSGLAEAVLELEDEHLILVAKHPRDATKPLVIYYNEFPQYHQRMDPEFIKVWSDLELPAESDMQKELSQAGLKVLQVEASGSSTSGQQQGRRKRRQGRAVKITNVHMKDLDLSVDYLQQPQKQK